MFILFCLSLWSGVFGDDAVKSESVMEGESITLNPDVNTINELRWSFIHNNKKILIAIINRQNEKKTVYDDALDGRFRDRLELDQTGSLIIRETRTTHSGLYTVTSSRSEMPLNTFSLTVYAPLPVPVISRDSSQNSSSSSSSSCLFLCSVVNVSDVSLSWYKGNSLFSSISVSDLSRSLSLHLECLDDFYSCVVNNPIRNQTQHLNTQLCQTCSDSVSLIVLISVAAAAGFLLIVAAVGIFCICKKHRKTDQEVQTRDREITSADPTFYKKT